MKLLEWAKEKGITLKEAKELTGVKHHLAKVPDEFMTEEVKSAPLEAKKPIIQEIQVVEEVKNETSAGKKEELPDGITPEAVWFSCRCHNKRSKLWAYRSFAKAPSNYRGRAIIFN